MTDSPEIEIKKPRGHRQKGTKNRINQLQDAATSESPKTILHMAFDELGGFKAFLAWAKKHPDKFYFKFFSTAPSSKPGAPVHRGGVPREQEYKVGGVRIESDYFPEEKDA